MKEFNDRYYPETIKHEHPVLKNKAGIRNYDKLMQTELEISIVRLFEIEDKINGNWDYIHLAKYHEYIFGDLYDWAGRLREFGVFKPEPALNGESVDYAEPLLIVPMVNFYLNQFKNTDLSNMTHREKVSAFSQALAGVWQGHPFNEGNTRTITRFMVDLAKNKGLEMNESLFGEHSEYFRTSLVAYTYGKSVYLETIVGDAIQQGDRNMVPIADLPILINGFVKERILHIDLINKKFAYDNNTWQILEIQKTRGQAQAEALIYNCDTQKTYLEKNFAGDVPFKLKLNNETHSFSLQTNKNIQE